MAGASKRCFPSNKLPGNGDAAAVANSGGKLNHRTKSETRQKQLNLKAKDMIKAEYASSVARTEGAAPPFTFRWMLPRLVLTACLVAGVSQAIGAQGQEKALQGTVPPIVSTLTPIGTLPGTNQLQLSIGLPLHNKQALSNLVHQLYDAGSTNYRHFLTSEKFTELFGPTRAEYNAVMNFVESKGLVVTDTNDDRMTLDVSGRVVDIERAFNVSIKEYQHPTESRTFFSPDTKPRVPANLPILDISGLENYWIPHPNYSVLPAGTIVPNSGSAPDQSGGYFAADFRDAYVPGVSLNSLNGQGQTVALVEFDGFYTFGIQLYEQYAASEDNFPINTTLKTYLLNGVSGQPGPYNAEVYLDIDMALVMAPDLSYVKVYEGTIPNSILNKISNAVDAKQISCSWIGFNRTQTTENIFMKFMAQGQSFFTASGDYDAYTGNVNIYPADSPNVTSVGGTGLSTSGPEGVWESESVWNRRTPNPNGGNWGSSGGISSQIGIPEWQQGASTVANQRSSNMRNFPDVALTGENVWIYYNYYGLLVYGNVGGTSCAAPLWAGFTALVNQQAAANGQSSVGFLNPSLYAIGLGTTHGFCFHDTTTGDNTWSGSPSQFFAVPGYDLCTGYGTPVGIDLIDSLQAESQNFRSTASMGTERRGPMATLLPSGLVLVAGGDGAQDGAQASAELYDPTTEGWSSTAAMSIGRWLATATLLPDGRVLVAGGLDPTLHILSSAELYSDSPVGAWTPTASMSTPRVVHTATLLPNGEVLVAGGASGSSGSSVLSSSELYNPATDTWTPTAGSMTTPREYHTATLLPNGQVLVAGGGAFISVFSSSELYNPATDTWTPTAGSMTTPRQQHTATLLPNGQVLVAGGYAGGGQVLSSSELYDPTTGTWRATAGSMTTARMGATAVLLPNGLVLVAGGNGSNGGVLSSAELFDPTTETWTPTAVPMTTPRVFNSATLLPNGAVLVAGGNNSTAFLSSAELYNPMN